MLCAALSRSVVDAFSNYRQNKTSGNVTTLILLRDFSKILIYQISWKSIQWGAQLLHAVRKTDMTEIAVAFAFLPKVPANWNAKFHFFGGGGGSENFKYQIKIIYVNYALKFSDADENLSREAVNCSDYTAAEIHE